MYIDPSGEFLILGLIIVNLSTIALTLYVCSEPEENASENISASGQVNPNPSGLGFDFLGNGYSFATDLDGWTTDVEGNITRTRTLYSGQFAMFGFSKTSYEDGKQTSSFSIGIVSFSWNPDDRLNRFDWGVGLSVSASVYSFMSSSSGSIDVDYLNLLRKALNGDD